MKKIFSLLLCLLLVGMLSTALAVEHEPGDEFTISVGVSSLVEGFAHPGAGEIHINAADCPVSCTGIVATNGADNSMVYPSAPGLECMFGVLNVAPPPNMVSVKIGDVGTVSFKVNDDAKPGTYTIQVSGTQEIAAAYGSYTFTIPGCVECIPDAGEVTKKPTCTTEGEKVYKCTECGKVIKTEKLSVVPHDYTDEIVTLEPTCTEEGVLSFACTMCGDVSKTEVIDALGHKEGDLVVTKEASCVEPGAKQSTCTVCGTVMTDEVIPALGHKDDKGTVTTEPACEEEGTKTYKCTICGVVTKTEPVPAVGHKEDKGTVTTEPACETEGVKTFKCTVCGKELRTEKIAALGHKVGESEVTKAPTCTEPGLATGSCTVCGKALENTELPALGHKKDEGTVTTEPTCTAKGVKTFKCTVCGEVLETKDIDMLPHTEDKGTVTTEPTCDAEGVKTFKCSVCGKELRTEKIAALGHKEDKGTVTTEPTCTEDGVKVVKCTVCGKEIRTEKLPALGHVPGEWVIVKPATGNEDGLKELYCTVCGELIETAVIPGSVWFHMTVSSIGPRFRDVSDLTDKWNMFTMVDLSVDGEQTFDLIAGDIHVVGTMTVKVQDGKVTVTYTLNNEEMSVKAESLSIVSGLDAITTLEEMPVFTFGEEISIADQLGGDTMVVIFVNNIVHYESDVLGLKDFIDGRAYTELVEEMMVNAK